ncbi:MAG: fatty acid desaturase [Rhodobacteraceae bacterium]|nr:fatty acid desaturase [Paracoccaceae bacterium]
MTTHFRRDAAPVLAVEPLTFALITGTYAFWALLLFGLGDAAPWATALLLAPVITLHGSLTHEAVHGHPFRQDWANEALMFAPLGLSVPYRRFRDLHLAHHQDQRLTDPYDDPESNYLDPAVWSSLPLALQILFRLNNTLLGRVVIGPLLGQVIFVRDEARLIRAGERDVARAWLLHGVGVGLVLAVVIWSGLPVWAYLLAVYLGTAILRIRTYLEHRAHEVCRARTVIIEDRGMLAFLFLNNNLHVVHHAHPNLPWHALPGMYQRGKARFQRMNEGYVYRSYGEVFRRYLLRRKDPVAHPLWSREG